MSDKLKVFKVSPEGFSPVVFSDFDDAMQTVKELVENSQIGDWVMIEIYEMTSEELEGLPEHEGW